MSVSVAALLPCKTGSGIPATRSSAAVLILVLGSFRIDCRLLPHDLHPRAADARLRVSRLVHARARPRERSVAGLEPYPSSIRRGARRCGLPEGKQGCQKASKASGRQAHARPPGVAPGGVAAPLPRAVLPSLLRVRHHEQHQDHPAHFSCSTETSITGTVSHAVLTGYGDPALSLVFALFAAMLACLCFHTGLEPILTAVRSARENMASTP